MATESTKIAVSTESAPKPIGAYSQAIVANGTVYCSGQIGLNPENDTLREGLEAQARQTLDNMMAVLAEAGSSPEKVVKSTILLTDMDDFRVVNGIYAEYFTGPTPPARAAFCAKALPAGALVEIECVALV